MAQHGGYREPASPAPVSGPGSQSRRTDGGPAQKLRDLPDAGYGENAVYRDLQQQAPLSQSPGPADARASRGGATTPPVVPLTAPTQNAAEPVTAGADAGPGPGMAALGLPSPAVSSYQSAREFISQLASQAPDNAALGYLAAAANRGL